VREDILFYKIKIFGSGIDLIVSETFVDLDKMPAGTDLDLSDL
jgi:hypothetical protein